MIRIKVNTPKKFLKTIRKAPLTVQKKYLAKYEIFVKNPFDPRLKTHKLTGRLTAKYAFSVDYATRVVFEFESENEVIFLDIGIHEVYK